MCVNKKVKRSLEALSRKATSSRHSRSLRGFFLIKLSKYIVVLCYAQNTEKIAEFQKIKKNPLGDLDDYYYGGVPLDLSLQLTA